jgi:hypothetical protein
MSAPATAPAATTTLDDALSALRALNRQEVRLVGFIGGYDTFRIYGTLRAEDEFTGEEGSHNFEFFDQGSIVGAFVFYDRDVTECEVGEHGSVSIEEEGRVTWIIERF